MLRAEGTATVHLQHRVAEREDAHHRIAVGVVDDRGDVERLVGGGHVAVKLDARGRVPARHRSLDGVVVEPAANGLPLPVGEIGRRLGRHRRPRVDAIGGRGDRVPDRVRHAVRERQVGIQHLRRLATELGGHVVEVEAIAGAGDVGGRAVARAALGADDRLHIGPGRIRGHARRSAPDRDQRQRRRPAEPIVAVNALPPCDHWPPPSRPSASASAPTVGGRRETPLSMKVIDASTGALPIGAGAPSGVAARAVEDPAFDERDVGLGQRAIGRHARRASRAQHVDQPRLGGIVRDHQRAVRVRADHGAVDGLAALIGGAVGVHDPDRSAVRLV